MKLQSFFEKLQYIQSNDLRIIGGQPADPGEYPWQVMLVYRIFQTWLNSTTERPKYVNTCGGTLISDQWVLTADHCMEKGRYSWNYQIVLGGYINPPDYQRNMPHNPNIDEKVVSLQKIVRHPNGGLLAYDIALLKMSTRVTFGPKVFPACVPGPDYIFKNFKKVTTTGWGYTKTDQINGENRTISQ